MPITAGLRLRLYEPAPPGYRRLREVNPPGPGTRPLPTQQGGNLSQQGRIREAVQDFDRVISLQLDNAEAHLYRGKALARLDNYDAAVRDFGRAIELDLGDAESYYERGSARIELGEYYGAIEDLEEAVRVNPQHPYGDSGRKVAAELLESTKAGKDAGKGLTRMGCSGGIGRTTVRIKLGVRYHGSGSILALWAVWESNVHFQKKNPRSNSGISLSPICL